MQLEWLFLWKRIKKKNTPSEHVARDNKFNFNKFIEKFDMDFMNLDSLKGFWIPESSLYLTLIKDSTALEPTSAGNILL